MSFADRILELGPRTGETTQALLSQMKPDSRLLAIEKIEAFVDVLLDICDPCFSVELADACDLIEVLNRQDFGKVDVVLSGIPFCVLPSADAARIVQSIYEALHPGGLFIAYQLRAEILREPNVDSWIAVARVPLRRTMAARVLAETLWLV